MGNGRSSQEGLSSAQAKERLRKLGAPAETSSRSTSSIVAGNVFTLFNAIIGVFFVLDLGLGLYADSIFGLIAVVNSYIGIRQELKAKATLDELAVLVAPHARVRRDGEVVELLATEVVPGDVVEVSPGDQLVADGEVLSSRGMTLDESMLTGEADGIRKGGGERVLSGSFCISGSGQYVVDAVREDSYAGRLAGEARAFRHPPSPLQTEVNSVILACTYVMIPLAVVLLLTLKLRNTGLQSAAQTATAGLVTLIPEGLVLLMSVTFAVAAVRLARRDTLIQQMSATESLASVDTICVDKTGTLTEGELRLQSVVFADDVDPAMGAAVLGRFAASAGNRNQTLETIAERYPGEPGQDVYLTIDRQVQALADERCGEESAAMVVMDCNNGDIIALSSTPGFDPNWFNVGLSNAQWHDLTTSDHKPLLNKVTSGIYPPGSTFKTAVALAAIESGVVTPDYRVTCSGVYNFGGHAFHCWQHKGHGTLDLEGALKNSCDVFFYETARRLGIDKIEEAARKLGLGANTGIELPGEHSGLVPSRAWKQKTYKSAWQQGDTLSVAIGQGYVTATPLQLCQQAARLASGKAVSPRMVHSVGSRRMPRAEAPRLDFSDEALAYLSLEALDAKGLSPEGYDAAGLRSALAKLGPPQAST